MLEARICSVEYWKLGWLPHLDGRMGAEMSQYIQIVASTPSGRRSGPTEEVSTRLGLQVLCCLNCKHYLGL